MRRRKQRRRRSASAKQTYILSYTTGNVARRTGETRDAVSKWLKKATSQAGLQCPFCGTPLTVGSFAVDHKEAISRGGSRLLSNCHLVCQPCNRAKGDLNVEEFTALLAFLNSQNTAMKKSVLTRLKMAGALFK